MSFLPSAVQAGPWRVGILQSVNHQALNDTTRGVKQYFRDEKIAVDFILRVGADSSDSQKTLKNMLDEIVDYDPDLIITLGTQSSQLAARHIDAVPVVFNAVTDPVGSGLVKNLAKSGTNMTGLSDMSPVSAQLEMILMVHPELKSLGIMFSEFEQNAVMIRNHLKAACDKKNIKLTEAPVGRQDSVAASAAGIIDQVEAIYIPTDNNIVARLADLMQVSFRHNIPLYAADPSSVEKGAVAALCFNYFSIGLQTGEIGLKVLKGDDPADMPVGKPRDTSITINVKSADIMELNLPMNLLLAADKIYNSIPDDTL
ncbi:MAG: ABC transporter substrate-binding protein [Desulfobacteraceae bacterium]|nr:ABC transporter substrate-binding protein [Desulfobacteraceae bacterium]